MLANKKDGHRYKEMDTDRDIYTDKNVSRDKQM
jgi:hypothetical protein